MGIQSEACPIVCYTHFGPAFVRAGAMASVRGIWRVWQGHGERQGRSHGRGVSITVIILVTVTVTVTVTGTVTDTNTDTDSGSGSGSCLHKLVAKSSMPHFKAFPFDEVMHSLGLDLGLGLGLGLRLGLGLGFRLMKSCTAWGWD